MRLALACTLVGLLLAIGIWWCARTAVKGKL